MPSMLSVSAIATAAVAAAPALASTPISLRGPTLLDAGLSLNDFQEILRTGLDEELDLIAAGPQLPARRGNVRRRDAPRQPAAGSPHTQREVVWSHMLHHAWNAAESISGPCPFLLCSASGEAASSLLERFDGSLPWTPSGEGDKCVVFSATAARAREAMASNGDSIVQPLVDVMKIHPGTMDSVTSPAWRVPFRDGDRDERGGNATEISVQHWERTLTVGLAPGSDVEEESSLVELIETIMRDLREMSEVGWLARQSGHAAQVSRYLAVHHLDGVPSLSDTLSVTSAGYQAGYGREMAGNDRVAFWDGALSNGLESSHGCGSMFGALFADPRPAEAAFDVVLNPNDGPPPGEREGSASNADCVVGLIAGLSAHPAVLSVEANVPLYYGWTAALS